RDKRRTPKIVVYVVLGANHRERRDAFGVTQPVVRPFIDRHIRRGASDHLVIVRVIVPDIQIAHVDQIDFDLGAVVVGGAHAGATRTAAEGGLLPRRCDTARHAADGTAD